MSEPVGNQPRNKESLGDLAGISGNSHKSRDAASETTADREALPKIIEGTVVVRKTPWYKKISQNMIAEDAGSLGEHILLNVMVPTAKDLIVRLVSESVEMVLFGSTKGRVRRPTGLGLRQQFTSYDRVREEREPQRYMSRTAQARHDFSEIVLPSRVEAISVVDNMMARVEKYGAVTVADLYDYVGITGSYQDQRWGWSNLDSANVRQVPDGFLLDLPSPGHLSR